MTNTRTLSTARRLTVAVLALGIFMSTAITAAPAQATTGADYANVKVGSSCWWTDQLLETTVTIVAGPNQSVASRLEIFKWDFSTNRWRPTFTTQWRFIQAKAPNGSSSYGFVEDRYEFTITSPGYYGVRSRTWLGHNNTGWYSEQTTFSTYQFRRGVDSWTTYSNGDPFAYCQFL